MPFPFLVKMSTTMISGTSCLFFFFFSFSSLAFLSSWGTSYTLNQFGNVSHSYPCFINYSLPQRNGESLRCSGASCKCELVIFPHSLERCKITEVKLKLRETQNNQRLETVTVVAAVKQQRSSFNALTYLTELKDEKKICNKIIHGKNRKLV